MKHIIRFGLAALCALAIVACNKKPSDSASAPKPADASAAKPRTPLDLGERYTALLAEGKAKEAFDSFIDFGEIADRIHAEAGLIASDEERAQVARSLHDMLLAPYVDPTTSKTMNSARYSSLDAVDAGEGITIVSYTVLVNPPIGPRMAHAIHVQRLDRGGLKIVDLDTGRGTSMAKMFGLTAKASYQRPAELVREFHEMAMKRLKAAGGTLPESTK